MKVLKAVAIITGICLILLSLISVFNFSTPLLFYRRVEIVCVLCIVSIGVYFIRLRIEKKNELNKETSIFKKQQNNKSAKT